MRNTLGMAIAIAAFVALPSMAFAQSTAAKPAAKPAAAAKSTAKADASHATTGVVKSIDANTLVITHSKKDMSFMINSSTQKDASIAVGSNVSVRYHVDGKNNVASAIMAAPAKPAASSTKSSAKK